jgi:putative zinc finger/helix-turn-helix YgiT family protein
MTTTAGRRCHRCKGDVALRHAPPSIWEIKYDGAIRHVPVVQMPEWHCAACEVATLHDDSDEILQDALRKHMRLLRPTELRTARESLGLKQKELADLTGCASESLSRWETGAVLQSRAYDRLLRIFFHLPEARELLADLELDPTLGSMAIHSTLKWAQFAASEVAASQDLAEGDSTTYLDPELCAA